MSVYVGLVGPGMKYLFGVTSSGIWTQLTTRAAHVARSLGIVVWLVFQDPSTEEMRLG
jgi:hypothetical protein